MSVQDDDFDKEYARLVEVHRRGLKQNPLVGPPDVGVPGGAKPSEFFDLLGRTAKDYTPSDYLKKLPL